MKARVQHALEGFWGATWAQRKTILRKSWKAGLASLPPVLASQWLILRQTAHSGLEDTAAGFQGWLEWVPVGQAAFGPIVLAIITAFVVAFGRGFIEFCTAIPRQRREQRKLVLDALARDPSLFARIQDDIEGVSNHQPRKFEEAGEV